MSGHTKWEDVRVELLGKKYSHAEWMMHLGDNPWLWMDLTAAKEETHYASELLWIWDQLPNTVRMIRPVRELGHFDV